MALLNFAHHEITAQVVVIGAPKAGAHAIARALWSALGDAARTELYSFGVGGYDEHSTVFSYIVHDLLVKDLKLRIRVVSLPGAVSLPAHRAAVLRDADALVFVADARASRETANLDALLDAERGLANVGLELERLPVVIAVNHMDHPDAKEVANVVFDLNPFGFPVFPTVAVEGLGVAECHLALVHALADRLTETLSGQDSSAVVTAVHNADAIAETDVVERYLNDIRLHGQVTPTRFQEAAAISEPSGPALTSSGEVHVPYQPRDLAGSRATSVAGAALIEGQVAVDLVLDRLAGGQPTLLRVWLDDRPLDAAPVPRAPQTSSITPSPITSSLDLDPPDEDEPSEDLPPLWYGVAGLFGGLIIGLLLGLLLFS